LYTKVVFMNMLHDVVTSSDASWETVREAMSNDPRIGESHMQPLHQSGHLTGEEHAKRGAGGHCFIKDFEAFRQLYTQVVADDAGMELLLAMVQKNNDLLLSSEKDVDLLQGVYGDSIIVT